MRLRVQLERKSLNTSTSYRKMFLIKVIEKNKPHAHTQTRTQNWGKNVFLEYG